MEGPTAAFAVALRKLRADAGGPPYRSMARRSFYGHTTLAEAASGQRFPGWEVTRAYVTACGGDLAEWERRWRETAELLNRSGKGDGDKNGERSPPRRRSSTFSSSPASVDPRRARTLHELMGMLDELRRRAGLSLRQLVDRSRSETGPADAPALARTTMSEFLQGARPPRVRDVLRIVELCGGTPSDLRRWEAACWRLVPVSEGDGPVPAVRPVGVETAMRAGEGESSGPRGGPTARRILLGARLRGLREAGGFSIEDAGRFIRCSASKVVRIELGRVGVKVRDVADLLTLYGVTDPAARASLLRLADEANRPDWWQWYGDTLRRGFEVYLGLEEAASVVRTYELPFVPELMQTEDYARAVVRLGAPGASEDEVERRVRFRMMRQERFVAREAPMLWAVLDEAVVRRPLGGRGVLRAQIRRLIEMAELAHVSLQIVPFKAGWHSAAGGPFTILRFAEPDLSDVVYLGRLTGAHFVDKRAEVDVYTKAMNDLSVTAVSLERSVRYLVDLLKEI
ncbi:Scr1 family TA system antitoxin-like transcriptional regulator [Actinomadura spongiicola]|nr:Scr1 family TA system antitoxin-like transcriptional regulator [Actinomadura spongiicola]